MIFLLFLAEKSAFAGSVLHPDLRLNLNGRTHPVGAQIMGSLGLAYPLWGEIDTWKYGYLRGGLNLFTSAVVNRAGIEFQLFPISIAGVTVGYDTGIRNFLPRFLDCNLYECTGRVDRKHIRFNLMAAHSGFAFMLMGRYEEIRGFNSIKPVYDEITLLIGRRSGERIVTFNPVLLYRVAEHASVGLVSLYSHAVDTGGYSHLYGPVVNLNPQPRWNALVGAGLNSSPVVHSGICGFFLLQYNIKPSLGVVDLALRNAEKSANRDASESLSR